jgi:hypothetical protein
MNFSSLANLPDYSIVVISCIFAVLCGIVFKDILEYQFSLWKSKGNPSEIHYKTPNLKVAYLFTCLFATICVCTSLSTFDVPPLFAYPLGAIVVIPTAILVWVQLDSMLSLAAREGIDSIRIDVEMSDREAFQANKNS